MAVKSKTLSVLFDMQFIWQNIRQGRRRISRRL